LALLNNWLDNSITRNKNITLYYKMSPTRKNRSHRKNHSRKNHSRKNHSRKNRSHRRNRNNSMVGGFLKGPPPPPTPCTPSAGWSFTKS
jgi:hypothetical protein